MAMEKKNLDSKRIACIYIRLANDNHERELQQQKQLLLDYAEKQRLEVIATYSDIGSGVNYNRKGLAEMQDAAARGKFDVLLVKDLSRLGRDYIKNAKFIDTLKKSNVTVITPFGEVADATTDAMMFMAKYAR
jgi:DNA invertase Pin-like site-specific DNA recombinase